MSESQRIEIEVENAIWIGSFDSQVAHVRAGIQETMDEWEKVKAEYKANGIPLPTSH